MLFEGSFEYIFFALFALVAGTFLYKIIKNRGIKGAMFGAPIHNTVGEVAGRDTGLMNVAVRVHTLGNNDLGYEVGLELVAKSFASYQMMPAKLSPADANQLASLLQIAARGPDGT
jgi:hypothetical protein